MDSWRFIHVADMQPGSPKSYRYNPSWIRNWEQARRQIVSFDPDLLLVGGDITRDGSIHKYELDEMKADLDQQPFPVHVVAGNMDTGNKHARQDGRYRGEGQCTDRELNVTSGQLQQFAAVFGPLWWSIDHKNVRFTGLADMMVTGRKSHRR
jgi:3',5'-cyclic AMP phosphodiesterase CpdA